MMSDDATTVVRRVDPAATRPLRRRVLRPHQSLAGLVVPGEDHPLAGWFAVIVEAEVVACGGVFPEPRPQGPATGWRLRAMATAPELRGRGYGSHVLVRCVEHVASNGGSSVWCSARVAAADFYLDRGFGAIGSAYDVPGIGPHVTMEARVDDVTAGPEGRRSA